MYDIHGVEGFALQLRARFWIDARVVRQIQCAEAKLLLAVTFRVPRCPILEVHERTSQLQSHAGLAATDMSITECTFGAKLKQSACAKRLGNTETHNMHVVRQDHEQVEKHQEQKAGAFTIRKCINIGFIRADSVVHVELVNEFSTNVFCASQRWHKAVQPYQCLNLKVSFSHFQSPTMSQVIKVQSQIRPWCPRSSGFPCISLQG